MKTYFIFSDENGAYVQNRSKKFIARHPFYSRVSVVIDSLEWRHINNKFNELKKEHEMPIEKEIKWSYLWSLRHFQKNNTPIPETSPFKFLETTEYHKIIDFVEDSLSILQTVQYCKIICTYTDNAQCKKINPSDFLKMHFQEHMQRVEMEIQNEKSSIALFFVDPLDDNKLDKNFRDFYYNYFCSGDFYIKYKNIMDTLVIEHSHRNTGIQLADYVAGAFSAILKSKERDGYERGVEMFCKCILPYVRRKNNIISTIPGYGIREVPTNYPLRNEMFEHILTKVNKE